MSVSRQEYKYPLDLSPRVSSSSFSITLFYFPTYPCASFANHFRLSFFLFVFTLSKQLYCITSLFIMDNIEAINKLPGGLRHLRIRTDEEFQKYSVPVETVPRPGFNTTGKEVELSLNAYPITKFPSRTVYQYDVSCAPDESLLHC